MTSSVRPIVFYASARNAWWMILVGSLCFGVSIYAANTPFENHFITEAGTWGWKIFAFLVATGFLSLLVRPEMLVLNREGILVRERERGLFPIIGWDKVKDLQVMNGVLVVMLYDPIRFIDTSGNPARQTQLRLNQDMYGSPLVVHLPWLDSGEKELQGLLKKALEQWGSSQGPR